MTQKSCAAYLRRVKRRLRCAGADRRRLLSGLEAELLDAFPPDAMPSPAELEERFGAPGDLARELESALPPEVLARGLKRRRLMMGIGLAVCAVVIALLIVYIIWLVDLFNGYVVVNTEIIYKN